jgi:prepilin-type N-terminal cleavage/methylation domain-containing protein
MCRTSNARMARPGFTLIELMIVVVILAIAAAIVVPMASSAGSMQLRAAGNMVAADLEYAKSMSISRGQKYSVVFDPTNGAYWVKDQNGNTIAHPVNQGSLYSVSFPNDSRLNQVNIANVSFDGTNAVSFDYLGSPFNGSGGNLNSGVIILQAGGLTKTVNVEPVTGYISVN